MTIRIDETYHFEFDDELDVTPVEMMTMDEIREALDSNLSRAEWNVLYAEYCRRLAAEEEAFREACAEDFEQLTAELKAKSAAGTLTMDDVNYYSDYHKDMYGVRPRYDWLRNVRR